MKWDPDVAATNLALRVVALAAGGALFRLDTFYAIAQWPAGDGTGMQRVAEMPLGAVFFMSALPAPILGASGKRPIPAALGVPGLVAFAYLWSEIVQERADMLRERAR
jgi:hypothetical protein